MLSRCGMKPFHQIGGICRFLPLITPPGEKIKPYPVPTPRLTPSPLPFLAAHGRNWPTVELELAGDDGARARTADGRRRRPGKQRRATSGRVATSGHAGGGRRSGSLPTAATGQACRRLLARGRAMAEEAGRRR
jgi:hypothetical protein